jgi:hypothetical protein
LPASKIGLLYTSHGRRHLEDSVDLLVRWSRDFDG